MKNAHEPSALWASNGKQKGHIHLLLKAVSLPGFSCIENTDVDLQSPHQQDQTAYHMLPPESCLFALLVIWTESQISNLFNPFSGQKVKLMLADQHYMFLRINFMCMRGCGRYYLTTMISDFRRHQIIIMVHLLYMNLIKSILKTECKYWVNCVMEFIWNDTNTHWKDVFVSFLFVSML